MEREALRALPETRYEVAVWKKARLHPDCHVVFEKAYYSAMKSDLRNLASQQGLYHQSTYSYTAVRADLNYYLTAGVSMDLAATTGGWSASVIHSGLGTSEGCVVFYGDATTKTVGPTTASSAGEVACTR